MSWEERAVGEEGSTWLLGRPIIACFDLSPTVQLFFSVSL